MVGAIKCVVISGPNLVLTSVLVWFVDDNEAFFVVRLHCVCSYGNGGGDFFGMVGIVAVDVVAEPLEAAADAREGVENLADLVDRSARRNA